MRNSFTAQKLYFIYVLCSSDKISIILVLWPKYYDFASFFLYYHKIEQEVFPAAVVQSSA